MWKFFFEKMIVNLEKRTEYILGKSCAESRDINLVDPAVNKLKQTTGLFNEIQKDDLPINTQVGHLPLLSDDTVNEIVDIVNQFRIGVEGPHLAGQMDVPQNNSMSAPTN